VNVNYAKLLQYLAHLTAISQIMGAALPPKLQDVLNTVVGVVTKAQGFKTPDNIESILADVELALESADLALNNHQANEHLENILAMIAKSRASVANLKAGQVAQLFTVTEPFDGTPDQVDVFALRRSSALSKQLLGL
jgi:thioredoxin-like negative regulator of GroEL